MQPLRGVFPAAVTPFDADHAVDNVSLARLLARFESAGCEGVVVGGTNGEASSLSAVERRDLVRIATACAGSLRVIAGLGTESLPEALWLSQQAKKAGAIAVLAMAPRFWQPCPPEGVAAWWHELLDHSELPVILYNFPKRSGFLPEPGFFEPLLAHPNCCGLKDSSGDPANIPLFAAQKRPNQSLLIGDEKLLAQALLSGWTGAISGLANSIPTALVRFARDPHDTAWATLLAPLIAQLRGLSQPAHHKQLLSELGVLTTPAVRHPLLPAPPSVALSAIREALGEAL